MEQRSNSQDHRNTEVSQQKLHKTDKKKWKDKFSLWFLGVNNQFGYVVAITAAKDIIYASLPEVEYVEKPRHCCVLSTALILLMLTVPAFLMQGFHIFKGKFFGPFITFAMVISIAGYLMLAFANESFLSFPGVILISIGYGIGEYQLSEIRNLYEHTIGKKFRRGTHDGLIIGSLYYTVMRVVGVNMFYIFISLPVLPVLAMLLFWFLLRPPLPPIQPVREDSQISLKIFNSAPMLVAIEDKLRYILHLMNVFLPWAFIVFFDGVINQGLYEFIYFRGNFLNHFSLYHVYICLYYMGYYACLITKNLLLVRSVWICTVLQLIVFGIFIVEAIFFYAGYMWMILLLTYLQGINTGVAYTTTNHKMYSKEPLIYLNLAEATLKNLTFVMSIFSGASGFAVHYFLSQSPEPKRP